MMLSSDISTPKGKILASYRVVSAIKLADQTLCSIWVQVKETRQKISSSCIVGLGLIFCFTEVQVEVHHS
jgi:hypothetical protein